MQSIFPPLTRCGACLLVSILVVFPVSARADEACRFEAGTAYLYGWVKGSMQTPNGGELITTDDDRPTLAELGIDHASMTDFWINVERPNDVLYVGGRRIHMHGNSTLETDLLSQARTFPAGSAVETDVTFDWFRIGYGQRHFYPWGTRTIELTPSIGAALLTYDYDLTSPGLEAVDRTYSKTGVQLGLGVRATPTEKLTLSGQLLVPIALSNSANILSVQLTAKYQFFKRRDLEVAGLLGLGYEKIQYQDNQLVPNDIKLEISPMLLAGLEITF